MPTATLHRAHKKGSQRELAPKNQTPNTTKEVKIMGTTLARTPRPDLLPTEPTIADFRRVAAIVTLTRHRVDPASLWQQDDVAEKLWQSRNTMPFPDLAIQAGAVARDRQYKGPGAIYLVAAGVIKP